MHQKKRLAAFLLLIVMNLPDVLAAGDVGWIRNMPNAVVKDQVYRLNIQRINGKNPMPSHRYTVAAGEATIRVSLILEALWTPKLRGIQNDIWMKQFKMNVEAGTTYIIGGKVNPDASREEQQSGNFWHPVIYKKYKDG